MAVNVVPMRGRWYIDDYYLDASGKRKRLQRSTNVLATDPKEFAEAVAQKIYAKVTAEAPEAAAKGLHAPKTDTTLEAAIAKYQRKLEIEEAPPQSIATIGRCAKALQRVLPPKTPIGTIDEDTLLEYVAQRRKLRFDRSGKLSPSGKPVTNSTILRELAVLSNALKACKVRPPRWPDIKPNPARTRRLTPEQTILLCAALPEEFREYLVAYRHLGVRRAEITKILPEHVHLDARWVHVDGSKTKKAKRDVPLTDDMVAILTRRLPLTAPGTPVFPLDDKTMKQLYYRLHTALEKAGIQLSGISFNDLRRSFCTDMLLNDVSSSKVAALMGHETTKMVDGVYGRLNLMQGQLLPAVETLVSFGLAMEPPPNQ